MKRRDIINIIVLLLLLAVGFYRHLFRMRQFAESRFLLDTIITIKFETREKEGDKYLAEAFKLIESLENKLSFYKEGSSIWNFNSGETTSLKLNEDLKKLIAISSELYTQTDSLYDISIGRLSELWNFDKKWIPAQDSINTALQFVGFNKLDIKKNTIAKPQGFKLNLGSLAKGFIIDEVYEFIASHNIETGYINAGGDIRIFGQKKPLNIGIQHPRDDRNIIFDTLQIKNKAIVTSGDYERFFIKDGVRYHHILNPKTGYPCRTAVSVTVIADEAVIADAYSTALFLMEPANAIKLVNSLADIEAVILADQKGKLKSYESEGWNLYKQKER